MATKICTCRFCGKQFKTPDDYICHIQKSHNDLLVPDMEPAQSLYFLSTGKKHGNCVMCKKETTWNNETMKYNRFCNNPKCKQKYVEQFRNRMIGKYGKVSLLDDPEHQKYMLSKRSISGKYKWSDEVCSIPYTGSYEKAFFEYLDIVLDYDPSDIMSPSPHTYYYIYEGKKHFYIPDVYLVSLNLEVEIKDGGDNPNMHGKIQSVDKVKERLKDEIFLSNKNTFNYLKITNKNHKLFFDYLMQAKYNALNGINEPIIMIGK